MAKVILDNPRFTVLHGEGMILYHDLGNKDQLRTKIEKLLKANSIICEEVKVI